MVLTTPPDDIHRCASRLINPLGTIADSPLNVAVAVIPWEMAAIRNGERDCEVARMTQGRYNEMKKKEGQMPCII